MQPELFDDEPSIVDLDPGAMLLRGFAFAEAAELLDAIGHVAIGAPFRRFETPGGRRMSVSMTNCGSLGWTSSRSGYRYAAEDPETGRCWPALPGSFMALACRAAGVAGYDDFLPDVCLINRYEPGTRLSLHQDRDEARFDAPIVSVSLGLPATFLWGGPIRSARARRIPLRHGDVVVWGGPARLAFHGIDTLAPGDHPATGGLRYNLTFRRASPT